MTEGWHVGRKAILKYLESLLGITTWRTVQTWKKNGSILIRYTPEGRPFIIESEIKSQKIKQSEALAK